MSKSKIVLVVDVCTHTLQQSVFIMTQYLTQRLYNYPENSVAVVLVGTNSTDVSHLNGNVDHVDNITVAKPLLFGDKALFDFLKQLPDAYAFATTPRDRLPFRLPWRQSYGGLCRRPMFD